MPITNLIDLITSHEGRKKFPYLDSKGLLTAGVGRNLTYDGLRDDEIDLMLRNDIAAIHAELSKRDWYAGSLGDTLEQTQVRRAALIDMGMMGVSKLDAFVHMIAALRTGDWEKAAQEVLNSQWARDVGQKRSGDIAWMIRTATYPD